MTTTTSPLWGPDTTPKVILRLILLTCFVAIGSALIDPLLTQIFSVPGLQSLLSLSWYGVHRYYLWQPISYLFVQSTGAFGITLPFLIGLAFDMYILWIMGSTVVETVGTKPFLRLYFLSGIFAGLIALWIMFLTGRYSIVAGPMSSILALITVWTMLQPQATILLFFVFPIQAKWLLAGILGAIILIHVSQQSWIYLALYLSGALFGYLYALIAWHLRSPFDFTQRFDNFLIAWKNRNRKPSKIIDFKTGRPIEDDEKFMDAMLNKISQKGEKSLTWRERRRMNVIAEKKRKKPPIKRS